MTGETTVEVDCVQQCAKLVTCPFNLERETNSNAVAPLHRRLPVTKKKLEVRLPYYEAIFSETEKCHCLSMFINYIPPWDAAINFIRNHPPGHDSKGAKTFHRGTIIVYKNPPPGTKQGVKAPPPGHKVRKFHKTFL